MRSNRPSRTRGLRPLAIRAAFGVVMALLLLGVAATAAEPESPAPEAVGPTVESEPAAEHDAKGASAQDVQVHGHWTITVVDPDGSVVERREFDNAYSSNAILPDILGRQRTSGLWRIYTISNASTEVCENPVGTPYFSCIIAETADASSDNNVFKNLTVSVATTSPFELTLSGYLFAQRDGEIARVQSYLSSCDSATAPDDCPAAASIGGSVITNTLLGTPVPVTTGQQVFVSVEISFS